jgi:hypothetical protein
MPTIAVKLVSALTVLDFRERDETSEKTHNLKISNTTRMKSNENITDMLKTTNVPVSVYILEKWTLNGIEKNRINRDKSHEKIIWLQSFWM